MAEVVTDYSHLMSAVAELLLGKPNEQLSKPNELRYGNKGSLSVDLQKGTWFDYENNEGGGVLDLIRREANCLDPIDWLKKQNLKEFAPRPQFKVCPAPARSSNNQNDVSALRRWRQSIPAEGTLVETYLRSRAIVIPPPPTLRFHPALPHKDTGTVWPAMVGLVTLDNVILGIHRTYLARDGKGKAPVAPNKMALGPIRGGAVRLGPAANKLYIAEGIESALSIMQVRGESVWATLGTSGMKALVLPPEVREVVICADGDAPDSAAAKTIWEAGRRLTYQGRFVKIARPPVGKDFNDLLQEDIEDAKNG